MAYGALLLLNCACCDGWNTRGDLVENAGVTIQAQLPHLGRFSIFGLAEPCGCVAGAAALELQRPVLKNERTLFVLWHFMQDASAPTASRVCLFSNPPCGWWQSLQFIVPLAPCAETALLNCDFTSLWHEMQSDGSLERSIARVA